MREFKTWVNLSHKLPGVVDIPWLSYDFQGLGRLDLELIEMHGDTRHLISDPKNTKEYIDNMTISLEHEKERNLSRLWVLSAYEILRIIKELEPTVFSECYRTFRLIRIPLAKYEKMGNSKIRTFAWPAVGRLDGEVGWALEDGQFYTRNQLADELIHAVEAYASNIKSS